MISVLAEAVRELAAALHQPYEVEAEDTGLVGGKVYVLPHGSVCPHLTPSTMVCWVVRLGVDRAPFKDHIAAMMYLRVLGVYKEET